MISLKEIFGYFERTKRPTQSQFSETFSSFWHKSERFPQTQVLGLSDALNNKVERDEIKDLQAGILFQDVKVDTVASLPIPPNKLPNGDIPLDKWGVYVESEGYYYQYDDETKKWSKTPYAAMPKDVAVFDELALQWCSVTSTNEFNINTVERKVYIEGQVIVQWGKKFSNTMDVNEVVEYINGVEDSRYSGLNTLFYNRATNQFRFLRYTAFQEVTKDYLIVATFNGFTLIATNSKIQIDGEWISLIDNSNKISEIYSRNTKANFVPSASCFIPSKDIIMSLGNAVFSDEKDENGLNWYKLTFSNGLINNNTGFIGKNVDNLFKLNAYVTKDKNDINGLHEGARVYFKVRYKSNRVINCIIQYNNPQTGAYVARAAQERHVPSSEGEDKIFYTERLINNLPAGYEKLPISVCFQRQALEANDDYFIFRELTISTTPFAQNALITSVFDDEFYNQPTETPNTNVNVDLQPTVQRGNDGVQYPIADINLLLAYGQSNSTGQQTAPPLSITNYKGNLMQGDHEWVHYGNTNTDKLNPMYARPAIQYNKTQEEAEQTDIDNQMPCESPNIAFCNASKSMLDKALLGLADRKFLGIAAGYGGCSIEILSKNVPNTNGARYKSLLDAINKAKASADVMNKSICCSAITWVQGEYNTSQSAGQGWESGTNATNDKDKYKAYLKQLVTDLIADSKNTFNQEYAPLVITTQHGTGWLREFEMFIQMALLEASNEDNRTVMACPLYQVTNRGHLDPNGARWIGEYFSKVYNKVVLKGEQWKPLQPKKITKSRNTIILDYHVPTPPLRIDVNTVRATTNYGFQVRENGEIKTIQSVKIISATQIEIVCESDFVDDIEIAYAGYRMVYGNICDSDTYKALNNYMELPAQLKPAHEPKDTDGNVIYNKPYPLQNFSVQFYYRIEKDKSELIIIKG